LVNTTAQTFSLTAKPVLRALLGESVSPPPLWLMRQAGRYLPEYREIRAKCPGFVEFCLTPELAAEATLQPIRRYGFDAAILFSDILMVPYGLGQPVTFREGEGPVLEPVRNAAGVERLRDSEAAVRLAPVYETLRRVRISLPQQTVLIGFAGAPWTVACYMVEGGSSRDFAAVKAWAFGDTEGFEKLIDLLIEATAAHLIRQVAAGAEVLQLFDTWAGVLPESFTRRLVIRAAKEIVARVKKSCSRVPIIGFPRGIGALYLDYVRETGVDAVSFDSGVPVSWAAREIQGLVPVQGNLDPHVLVAGGAALRDETRRILEAFGRGPFVFNLGHGILPETPPEHVAELVRLVRGG
jgi:uroporphyrinogen decarboxylase